MISSTSDVYLRCSISPLSNPFSVRGIPARFGPTAAPHSPEGDGGLETTTGVGSAYR